MYSSDIDGKLGLQTFGASDDFQNYLNEQLKNLSIHKPIVCTGLTPDNSTIMDEIRKYADAQGIIEREPYIFTENIKYAK